MGRRVTLLFVGLLIGCSTATDPEDPTGGETVRLNENLTGRSVFPPDNWWNLSVASAPVDPSSGDFIDWLCGREQPSDPCGAQAHPDFGPPPYGIPYVTTSSDQPLEPVEFVLYGSESDVGVAGEAPGYPIPTVARTDANYIEGAVPGGGTNGDRHLILIDRDRWILFETWATRWKSGAGRWEAGSGAIFDLATNGRRPAGWTSADAAGLAVFPGLVRYDEVSSVDPIRHAHRFTARATNGAVWPASHEAGSTVGALPMGARLRLKSSVDLSAHPPQARKILEAFKEYGLILADNGSDLYVQGTMDDRWNNGELNPAFHSLTADDFEVIELGWRP